jgi:hypothetical protein
MIIFIDAIDWFADTLKYSKKYYLRYNKFPDAMVCPDSWCSSQSSTDGPCSPVCSFQYPRQIKVDENNIEASLDHGILTVTMPLTQVIDKETGKLVKFGVQVDDGHDDDDDTKPKKQVKKQQAKKVAAPKPQKALEASDENSADDDDNDAGEDAADDDDMDVSEGSSNAKAANAKAQQLKKKVPKKAQMSAEQRKMYQERKKPVEVRYSNRVY